LFALFVALFGRVALQVVGEQTASAFMGVFRRTFGDTPAAYRAQL